VLFVVGLAMGRWVVVAGLPVVHVLSRSLIRTLRVALATVLTTVPPILNSIVAASFQSACNLCPPLAHLSYHLLDQLPLFSSDGIVI
jgi:hypothetical protein